jgi:hypothetical protein
MLTGLLILLLQYTEVIKTYSNNGGKCIYPFKNWFDENNFIYLLSASISLILQTCDFYFEIGKKKKRS